MKKNNSDDVSARAGCESGEATLPRVFVIGFNKCGTTSLHALFRQAGHSCVHFSIKSRETEGINIAEVIFANRAASQPLLAGLERFRVFSDMEQNKANLRLEAFKLFRELDEEYPDSRFILNLREKQGWLRSRLNQGGGRYVSRQLRSRRLDTPEELLTIWSREWDEHLAAVREYFSGRPGQLIEFDIENDDPQVLVDAFPGYGLAVEHWTKRNANPSLAKVGERS